MPRVVCEVGQARARGRAGRPDRAKAPERKVSRAARAGAVSGGPPTPRATRGLAVFALGPLRVFVGEREISDSAWKSRKGELVLEYLLARGLDEWAPKEIVLEALWPGQDPARSGQCLRAAISALRRTLEPNLPARLPSPYVFSKDGRCKLSLGNGGSYYDVAEFNRAVARAADCERAGDDRGAADAYQTAVSLYRGDFLEEELYADWARSRRERLRNAYAGALVYLGGYDFAKGDVSTATDRALRVLEIEPISEPAYRLVIACYVRRGQWDRAMVLYERYRAAMLEYDLASPATLQELLANVTCPARVGLASQLPAIRGASHFLP